MQAEPARLWRAALAALDGASPPQREAASFSPVARYLDPGRHDAELALLRTLPHAVAPAARLARPGDWLATAWLGVPILFARDAAGLLRAFVNVCRHRGAVLVPGEACGHDRARFVCPYHSWTYDTAGQLVGRPHEDDFPHVARETSGLVPLPVAERCGLVWVVPSAATAFDWDAWFGPLADEVESLGYAGAPASPHERGFEQPSNWKLVLDANLESYHFQYAHRATIAHLFHDNLVQHAAFGRHQRIVLPKRSLADSAAAEPDAPVTWDRLGRHANVIYFFFPSTFLLWEGDHLNGFSVAPLAPDRCRTASWMLVPERHAARRAPAHWARNWQIFWDAIDEDYALAASMQVGAASGANAALAFGRNEFACDRFERDVEALLDEAGRARTAAKPST